jgi:hypothetical protein
MLPATLSDEAKGDATRDDQFVLLQDKNFEHPIARVLNEAASGTLDVHFYRTFDLTPLGDEKAGPETTKNTEGVEIGRPRTVLRYQDGKPAMMERTWGAGRVVLFGSTADTAWNDLAPHGAVFVPLLSRTMGAIVSRQDDSLNIKVGERFSWRADNSLLNKDVLIGRPDVPENQAGGLENRKISLVNNVPLLTFDETSAAGAYPVKISGEEATPMVFAAQPDPDESRLDELSEGQIKGLTEVADVTSTKNAQNLVETIQKQRVGTEIWKYLALAVLALATAETILAHYFSKAK